MKATLSVSLTRGVRRAAVFLLVPAWLTSVSGPVTAESALDKLKAAAEKLQWRDVGGEYTWTARGISGSGTATVKQSGSNVRILLTWTPVPGGPHYEIKGKLKGDTIDGQWYSHYAKKGWYRFSAKVSGDSIDLANSDDPIRSNMNRVVLRKRSSQTASTSPAAPATTAKPANAPSAATPPTVARAASLSQAAKPVTYTMPEDFGIPKGTAKIAAASPNIDVVGVRLGMNVQSAVGALKSYRSDFKVTSYSLGEYEALPGVTMTPVITASNTPAKPGQQPETINLLVTYAPNDAFVWGIMRNLSFGREDQRPTVENTLAGLRKKYGSESFTYLHNKIVWIYDSEGKQVMGKRAKEIYDRCTNVWIVGSYGSLPGGNQPTTSGRYSNSYFDQQLVKGYFYGAGGRDNFGGMCQAHSVIDVYYLHATPSGSAADLVMTMSMQATNRQLEASSVLAAHTLLLKEATKLAEQRKQEAAKRGGPKF
ncbi:MAG TPA: hypothetical protein VGA88_05090 [Burkholderiales bacterium]